MPRPRLIAIALLCWCLIPSSAFAWGEKGHRIVALVALEHLSPAARKGVAALLSADPDGRVRTLDDAAVWPDWIKQERPETKPWHFVDIEYSKNSYSRAVDCPGNDQSDCIIVRIDRFLGVLGNQGASTAERREALKFLAHLVGDLHQPLHCAERNHDRGGNNVKVKWFGKKMNLHVLWDAGIIDRAGLTAGEFAELLLEDVTAPQVSAQQAGTVVAWAEAAHTLARSHAYRGLGNGLLGQRYYDQTADAVDEQLLKAGLRLARLLNSAF